MAVYVLRSDGPGAPPLSGSAGALLSVLDAALVVRAVYTYDGVSYFDQTPQAFAGPAFPLFPGSSADSACYIGSPVETTDEQGQWRPALDRLTFALGTQGLGGTYAWEYWNGNAWAALAVNDGTAGFTADGTVSWTPPEDWAPVEVNGLTTYWVRVRPVQLPSQWPTCASIRTLGWARPFASGNVAAYRQAPRAGRNAYYLRVQDNLANASEARVIGYETMSDLNTGTYPFPSDQWYPPYIVWRKSATNDATARPYYVFADARTIVLFTHSHRYGGDFRLLLYFGDIVPLASQDPYACMLIGGVVDGALFNRGLSGEVPTYPVDGHVLARDYTGNLTAVEAGKHWDFAKCAWCADVPMGGTPNALPWPNPPDGKIWLSPVWVNEADDVGTWRNLRGYLRGVWAPLHNVPAQAFGSVIHGVGHLAGHRYVLVGPLVYDNSGCAAVDLGPWESE